MLADVVKKGEAVQNSCEQRLDGLTTGYSLIQFLPSRYNTESELIATVRSDGKNVYTFELTTP